MPSEGKGIAKGIGPVQFSPDGKTLAIATGDGVVLWEVVTRQVRAQLELPGLIPLGSIAFAPDGKGLATGGEGSRLRLWDLTAAKSKVLDVNPESSHRLAFSPDGKFLAFGGKGSTVKLWDLAVGKESATLGGKGERICDLAFSPDGKTLAAAGGSRAEPVFGEVWLWDVAGRQLRTTLKYEVPPTRLVFSPNGQSLAVDHGGIVQLHDSASGHLRATWKFGSSLAWALAFSPDGRVLAAGGGLPDNPGLIKGKGEVKFWDLTSKKEILTLRAHEDEILWIALSPDGKLLAVSTGAPSLPMNLWDVSAVTAKKPPGGLPAAPARARPDPIGQGAVPAGNLTPAEFEKLWSDLAGADAARAYQAIWALTRASRQSLPQLAKHLRPVPATDPKRVEQLIADLDSNTPTVRERAARELEELGELAEPALRRALAGQPSPEAGRHIRQLLEKQETPAPERLRALRAVEALEYIGDSEAWKVLETLAKGAPQARVTQEAMFSLERLSKRPAAP